MANRMAVVIRCAVCVGIFALAAAARAQCEYEFTSYPSSELDGSGGISAMTVFDDGSGPVLVVGGSDLLQVPGGSSIDTYGIAKWSPAAGWVPLGDLQFVDDLEVFNGELYATVWFGTKRWTGSEWVNVGQDSGGAGRELMVFDDRSGSGAALFLVRGSGLLKLINGQWQRIAQFTGSVSTLEVFEGELIAGGSFTAVSGMSVNGIARWDGRRWLGLGEGIEGRVDDLAAHEIGGTPVLVASGSFTQAGQSTAQAIAYWDGSSWTALPSTNLGNQVRISTLVSWDNGGGPQLHAAVTIEEAGSADQYDRLYRLDQTTQLWHFIGTAVDLPYSGINGMIPFHDGASPFPTLFVGGHFERFGTLHTHNLVRILPQPHNTIEPIISDPRSLTGAVNSFASFDDGGGLTLYAGGRIRSLPPFSFYTLVARFDGDAWTSIGWGNGDVRMLKTLDDGTGPALYAAGAVGNIQPNNGVPASGVAKWDGAHWLPMGSPFGSVVAICQYDDGTGPAIFYASSNGVMQRWNPGSQSWVSFASGLSGVGTAGPLVTALASFDDGSGRALYVAGSFDAAGGVPAGNIARWRNPVEAWSPVGEGLPSTVTNLHVHDDGSGAPRLIATGAVGQPGGLAQWDGSTWSAVGDPASIGLPPTIDALTTFHDGSGPALIVGTSNRIARWNGSFWAHIANEGADALGSNGDVLYTGLPFSTWAPGDNELAITSQPQGGSFEEGSFPRIAVAIEQGGAVTYQWRRDGVPLMNVGSYHGVGTHELRISNINGSHEGVYDVVVANDCDTIVSEPAAIEVIGTCLGDVTVDEVVHASDLLAIIASWGACPQFGSCPADLSHDASVNVADLLMVIQHWGVCP